MRFDVPLHARFVQPSGTGTAKTNIQILICSIS